MATQHALGLFCFSLSFRLFVLVSRRGKKGVSGVLGFGWVTLAPLYSTAAAAVTFGGYEIWDFYDIMAGKGEEGVGKWGYRVELLLLPHHPQLQLFFSYTFLHHAT